MTTLDVPTSTMPARNQRSSAASASRSAAPKAPRSRVRWTSGARSAAPRAARGRSTTNERNTSAPSSARSWLVARSAARRASMGTSAGTNTSRLANCAQTARNSALPPSLARVFSYSARRSASVQSRRANPTIAHSEGRFPPRASWNSAAARYAAARVRALTDHGPRAATPRAMGNSIVV